ncbi:hypothetical protein ACFSLT_16385 [Novosphingobium resinovorum]
MSDIHKCATLRARRHWVRTSPSMPSSRVTSSAASIMAFMTLEKPPPCSSSSAALIVFVPPSISPRRQESGITTPS